MAQGVVKWISATHHWCDSWKIGSEFGVHHIHEDVLMLSHPNSVIDARKFIVISDENDGLREIQIIGFWVDVESLELRENFLRNRCISLCIFPLFLLVTELSRSDCRNSPKRKHFDLLSEDRR